MQDSMAQNLEQAIVQNQEEVKASDADKKFLVDIWMYSLNICIKEYNEGELKDKLGNGELKLRIIIKADS